MDDPEYVAMLKRKKMKMNLIVFGICFGITLLLVVLVLGLKSCKNGKADPAENDKAQNSATAKGKSNKAIPQAAPVENLTEVQKEFNEKYAKLMKVKESDPGKFDEERLSFCTFFQEVAQAKSLTKKQLGQFNELAKEFGLEVEITEETASDSGAEGGENTAATATPGGNPEKSKEYKADYDKLSKYLNANRKVTDRHTKAADILDELDKQLGMMREFMEKWEIFPKTPQEQKWYDDVNRIYKIIQQSRDAYAM